MEIPHVELSKDNSFWILFVLARLIGRKLHYWMVVSEYNVLRVINRFTYKKCFSFKSALELVYPKRCIGYRGPFRKLMGNTNRSRTQKYAIFLFL